MSQSASHHSNSMFFNYDMQARDDRQQQKADEEEEKKDIATSIARLHPDKDFCIYAKIQTKSNIREFKKAGGEDGKVFSVILIDEDGNDIEGVFFGDAADKFHPFLKAGITYNFQEGKIKNANAKYNKTKSMYQITFYDSSAITVSAQQI